MFVQTLNMKLLFVCTILVTVCYSRKLPPTFKRCDVTKTDFNECLSVAIPDAIRQLKKPMKPVGLPSMDPLTVPAISIGPSAGPTGFEQNYTDFKVSGFTAVSCPKIELDFEALNMSMRCAAPRLTIDTNYYFNGSMVVMDIYGNGSGTIILDEVRCYHSYDFEEYWDHGRKHFRVTNSSLDINPQKITFKFENLYDGDEILEPNVNFIMNDNWREIWADLKPKYEEAFTKVFQALFNSVLSRVAVSDIFING